LARRRGNPPSFPPPPLFLSFLSFPLHFATKYGRSVVRFSDLRGAPSPPFPFFFFFFPFFSLFGSHELSPKPENSLHRESCPLPPPPFSPPFFFSFFFLLVPLSKENRIRRIPQDNSMFVPSSPPPSLFFFFSLC